MWSGSSSRQPQSHSGQEQASSVATWRRGPMFFLIWANCLTGWAASGHGQEVPAGSGAGYPEAAGDRVGWTGTWGLLGLDSCVPGPSFLKAPPPASSGVLSLTMSSSHQSSASQGFLLEGPLEMTCLSPLVTQGDSLWLQFPSLPLLNLTA